MHRASNPPQPPVRSHWALFFLLAQGLLLLMAAATNAQQPSEPAAPAGTDTQPAQTPPAPAPAPAESAPAPAPDAKDAPSMVFTRTPPSHVAASPSAAPAAATEPAPCVPEDDGSEGFGAFLLGAGVFDLSSLNDVLAANGYDRVTGPMTIIGGEGHAVLRSGFVIGGRGAAILGPSGDGPAGVRTHYSGGYGLFDLGFALVHTRTFLFTLLGGIGGYGTSLDIGDDSGASFASVLKNPKRGVSLSRGGVLTGLGLGLDGRVPLGQSDKGREGFFSLGLRVGGLYGPALGGWGLPRGADASGGPDADLAGLYALLAIGFGGAPTELGGGK